MLNSVYIEDNKKAPLHYLEKLPTFKNGKEYIFKPGINIIIGPNGCGKSTLINLISSYLFCERGMVTKIPNEAFLFPKIFDFENESILNGIKIHHDFRSICFRYKPSMEMNESEVMDNISNFSMFLNGKSASTGEKTLESLGFLFKEFNNQKTYEFPIKKLKELADNVNDLWKNKINSLLNYYEENKIKITQEEFEFTLLLDEPDRDLDIDNIESIYNILSYQKPKTQVIAVIHNPILIYKLSKLDYINWIEMKKGYLNKIKRIIGK